MRKIGDFFEIQVCFWINRWFPVSVFASTCFNFTLNFTTWLWNFYWDLYQIRLFSLVDLQSSTMNLQNFFLILLASTSAHGFTISCLGMSTEYVGQNWDLLHKTCYHFQATVDYIYDDSLDSIMGTSQNHLPGRTWVLSINSFKWSQSTLNTSTPN
jgi:hypothetical protein